ncbi:MAG: glycosyltransferase family 2 protein [Proteobacteria bacterium]|nr:glycosyltransferase family 2 protein [Pseudomonadota bacterium]
MTSPDSLCHALSVVVPVRDEAANIDSLLAEIHAALGNLDFELIYIDDGSRDGTAERLKAARARYPRLRVVTHRASAGQSAAMWNGVSAARAAWIATLDGDGQNDPHDIPKLVALAQDPRAPADLRMVAGVRQRRQDSWVRRLSGRIANFVRAALLHDATPDTGCGLKVFRRDAYLALPRFDHMHRFLPALIQREGGRVAHCPVAHRPRAAGHAKYGIANRLWVGIVDMAGVRWLQRRGRRAEIAPDDPA